MTESFGGEYNIWDRLLEDPHSRAGSLDKEAPEIAHVFLSPTPKVALVQQVNYYLSCWFCKLRFGFGVVYKFETIFVV